MSKKIEELKKLKGDLEDNWKLAAEAFNACPPQNPREIQVCETIRTMTTILFDLISLLTEEGEPVAQDDNRVTTEKPMDLAACEQRAIELYYAASPDKLAGDCRAELVAEFGEECVRRTFANGIGNNGNHDDNPVTTKPRHLRYCLMTAETSSHPVAYLKSLGIRYQHATPQSLGDQWWFWNCENVPETLPAWITDLKLDPRECVGRGLSENEAWRIASYEPKPPTTEDMLIVDSKAQARKMTFEQHHRQTLEQLSKAQKELENCQASNLTLAARCGELEQWKKAYLDVESNWEPDKVADLLGLKLGAPIRPAIEPAIRAMKDRITELEAEIKELKAGGWHPIETLDRSKMQFVLVHEDGAQRTRLWNPRGYWELGDRSKEVELGDECSQPTEWMPLPPNPGKKEVADEG